MATGISTRSRLTTAISAVFTPSHSSLVPSPSSLFLPHRPLVAISARVRRHYPAVSGSVAGLETRQISSFIKNPRDKIIDCYVKTLAQVVGRYINLVTLSVNGAPFHCLSLSFSLSLYATDVDDGSRVNKETNPLTIATQASLYLDEDDGSLSESLHLQLKVGQL
ncbi:unnamed protein product [Cuscuta campestris]|uniref:Uncharacterized protein n=1 Tax=Cuscuta campestris TaxID=132261 RepID=A0A484MRY7_9ASTE|nr:unnamed protein product [Cuscuta campestris]